MLILCFVRFTWCLKATHIWLPDLFTETYGFFSEKLPVVSIHGWQLCLAYFLLCFSPLWVIRDWARKLQPYRKSASCHFAELQCGSKTRKDRRGSRKTSSVMCLTSMVWCLELQATVFMSLNFCAPTRLSQNLPFFHYSHPAFPHLYPFPHSSNTLCSIWPP